MNEDINDDLKFKNSLVSMVYVKKFQRCRVVRVNPLAAKLFNLNFHPLKVVSL